MEETKVIYYVDDEETPYLMKISQSPAKVTLADFKGQLNRSYHKFFFKAMDDDIGVVKEEIADDAAPLPNTNGRVVCWVVTGESSQSGSDVGGGSKGELDSAKKNKEEDEISIISSSSKASSRRHRRHHDGRHRSHRHRHYKPHVPGGASASEFTASELDTATEVTTDADTTSYCDTEDTLSRVSASTLTSLPTQRRKVLTKHRPPKISRSASTTTITTTTMTDASMQVLTVTLNMDTVNFLGISIVGQTSEDGAGGIFVGSVMKGGAVAADGRIDTGDMLLEVNGVNFEHMTNDDAVRALREIVQQPGPITLTVAKCWDPEPMMPTFEPRLEPIRPIDPSAWVMHTNQHHDYQYGRQFAGSPTLSTMTSNSSPGFSSMPESDHDFSGDYVKLKIHTPMYTIAKALASPNSGLEVKDRVWLKITIPKSFIGSDLVDWLHSNVEGFIDRRHARKYAALMLKHGFVRHTVNKITFSEQCYYIFGDFKKAAQSLPSEFSNLNLSDSGGDADTLGPLPGQGGNWGSSDGEFPVAPYEYLHNSGSRGSHTHSSKSPSPEGRQAYGSHGSSASSSASSSNHHSSSSHNRHHSDNSNSNNRTNGPFPSFPMGRMRHSSSISSSSEFTSVSQQQPARHSAGSDKEPDRVSIRSGRVGNLGVAANLAQSRESFQQALDNPCEYFIDVM